MLLSIPTWIIHLSSMTEWAVAMILLHRYGTAINRKDLQRFAWLMLPHWVGGLCVLMYHTTSDRDSFWFDASKVLNLIGSLSLLAASLAIIFKQRAVVSSVAAVIFFVPTYSELLTRAQVINLAFQISSAVYFLFLISLIVLHRRDPQAFSPMTIFGFWFLLVFVAVAATCNHYATQVRGFATLTHDDLLHGFAESFLTITNLFIVFGIRQKLRTVS